MQYRCVTTSVTGFVQQLVGYLQDGYWFYRSGHVPTEKDPEDVDRELLRRYGIGNSRRWRARRRAVGIANVHYLRHHRSFLVLASRGFHPFYDEQTVVRDVRRCPIRCGGYSIGVVPLLRGRSHGPTATVEDSWRVHVELSRQTYRAVESYWLAMAKHLCRAELKRELSRIPYEPYGPVRRQLLEIVAEVNRVRERAGRKPLGSNVVRRRRRIVHPFQTQQFDDAA